MEYEDFFLPREKFIKNAIGADAPSPRILCPFDFLNVSGVRVYRKEPDDIGDFPRVVPRQFP